MKQFSLELPINPLSFGNVSVGILREMYARGLTPPLFTIGNPDLSAQVGLTSEFHSWIQHCILSAQAKHSRKDPVFRLWHIPGSLQSYSATDSRLITFNELDSLTPAEVNILKNMDKVYVTSNYTASVFKMFDVQSTYLPIGFDAANFKKLDKDLKIKDEISFLIAGKLEQRKGHFKVLNAWAKKYGNKHGYKLNMAVHNPFLGNSPEQAAQNAAQLVNRALEGKHYWNINVIPFSPSNSQFNEVLQSSHIYIAMSGGEGRDLCAYHATAMGAHVVALKAHAYLDYLNDANAVLVNPNSKIPCYDGIFFHPNQPFNQGNLFDWDVKDFDAALDIAEARAKVGENTEGLKLQQLTYKDTVDVLLKDLV